MKIAFLALLLLNLGLLAWHYWVDAAPRQQTSGSRQISPPRQMPARPEPVASRPSVAAADAAPGSSSEPAERVCAEFGPFADRSSAIVAAATLGQNESNFEIAPRKVSIVDSYRVYFPPYPTAAAAQAMRARLRSAGVKDVYIIPGGAQQNAVSVGVFKDRDGAERRRRHLGDLGFEPRIEPLVRHDEERYWIRVNSASAADLLRQTAAESGGEKRTVSCTHVAAAPANP